MRARKPRYAARVAGLAIAMVLAAGLVTACGSSSTTHTATVTAANVTTTAAVTSSSTATGTPIDLVALFDVTGPANGYQGDAVPVLQAWEKYTNAHGGVGGHPVNIQVEDTEGNASLASADAEKAVKNPSVVGAIVVDGAGETTSVPILSKAGLPVIGGVGYSPELWGAVKGNTLLPAPPLKNVFLVNTAAPASESAYVSSAKYYHLTNFFGVSDVEEPNSAQAIDFVAKLARVVGLKVSQASVSPNAASFTAQCVAIQQAKAQVVLPAMPGTLSQRLIEACQQEGYKGAWDLVGSGLPAELFTALGDAHVVGGLWGFPWYANTPAVEHYRSVMKTYDVPSVKWEGGISPAVWTTLELLNHVVQSNASTLGASVKITRGDLITAYGTVKNETLGGLLPGPVTFTPGAVAPPACYWLYSEVGGHFTGTDTPTCPSASLGGPSS
jgi:branched-chain amino acid transport system substrate-binding protein